MKQVYLILDNLKVNHEKKVAAWLEKNADRIEVFFIPPYSPEINPDEYLNHVLKKDVHAGIRPRTKMDLHHKTESFLRRMQHSGERVRKLFHHPLFLYIHDCEC